MANVTANEAVILDSGTYEIIRNRLADQRVVLNQKLSQLNVARKEIFNTTGFELIANQRITTENNGVARGIMAFGDVCIFAYNVHFGLREDINLSDVFSIYKFEDNHFEIQTLSLVNDTNFVNDFTNLYKYYRDSIFSKFSKTENFLYMIFQTSKNPEDRKAFKWLIKGDTLVYIDDRSIHEVKKAPQHDFQWTKTILEDRRLGVHPHISILEKVFIEAVGGDITFKIENNTDSGKGIYSEPVINKDQQLDDAQYYYADLGNLIAIKIQPYQEAFRSYIYNIRTKEVLPIKLLLDSAILLPDNQGVIFPNGYYLQNGDYKIFESEFENLEYIRSIAAPNGEDFFYIFYQTATNTYVLMSYNVIMQQVQTPIVCNGFTIFDDGKLIYFKSELDAVRHHQVQIWETPYTKTLMENSSMKDNVLYKIGNKDIVKAMSEGQEIIQLLSKEDSYEGLYEDIYKKSNDLVDAYFWIKDPQTFELAAPLLQIKEIANTAIDEFAKVQTQRKHATDVYQNMKQKVDQLVITIKNTQATALDELVQLLATTRTMQGSVIDLLNTKYIDVQLVEALKTTLQNYNAQLSEDTVNFLLRPEALKPYEEKVFQQKAVVEAVTKVIDAQKIEQDCKDIATALEMLIDILNSLKIEDATQTTQIIEKISIIFASLNEVKAALIRKINSLKSKEATGSFYAQMTLLDQSIVNFLDLSTAPEKCDEYFTKISIQVEELESKFADFEEFVNKIADKRDALTKAFSTKKEILVSQINKRATALEQIGTRVLKSIENKAQTLENKESIYAFFSADLMIDKIRNLVVELKELGDVAKAENLANLLKVAQEDAVRNLKDKTDLFVDGQNIIALGDYKFIVNKQVLNLTILRKNDQLFYHLLGTSFYKLITEKSLYAYQSIWEQALISENNRVYRSEYLAYQAYNQYITQKESFNITDFIVKRIEQDYAAGYIKGVHDADAILIFESLKKVGNQLGVLKYAPNIRVAAQLFWLHLNVAQQAKLKQLILAGYAITQSFPESNQIGFVLAELKLQIEQFEIIYPIENHYLVAEYLYQEFSTSDYFTASLQATTLLKEFTAFLDLHNKRIVFEQDTKEGVFELQDRFYIIQNWVSAFVKTTKENFDDLYVDEVVSMLLFSNHIYHESFATDAFEVHQLKGTHDTIQNEIYTINYHHYIQKLTHYFTNVVPTYQAFNLEKEQLINQYKHSLRISEFEPKVLSSFVRNRLINEIYFPLIGANLAKQLGTAGDDKRTARMGMLLLLSPPGYGKTTLMEYLAKTMGLHFMKINGPTIGHHITSIDPIEAKTSGAREELKKINLAFEMADNVMLYLDDIQHCNPEFLQKFISLADGQRKMDGIFEGESKTYDLRGKRFCVVMAGNPYTESGEQFRIPDMLANRADVYNLGDVIGNSDYLFNLSLIENAVAENRYLQIIANRSFEDLYKLIQFVELQSELLPDLEGNYNTQEIDDAVAVIKQLLQVRNVVVAVNRNYIESAAMKDQYRVEPAFKLQGSYRNMNKLVNKIVPLMNDMEVQTLILSHYEAESQTLTADAEANLLKLKSIAGIINAEEQKRWDHIIQVFLQQNKFSGLDKNDSSGQMLVQLNTFNEQLAAIAKAIINK